MKIEKVKPKTVKRGKVKIDEQTEVAIEYDGEEVRVIYDNQVISRAGGDWEEFTFVVKDYKVSIRREEVEAIARES